MSRSPSTVPNDRRRGIAGTVLVHKIAGAAAAAGLGLAEVAQLARTAAADVGTMGVALGACTLPAAGRAGFELGPDEIELGLGIHGEAGVERAPMMPADALVERLLASILADRRLRRRRPGRAAGQRPRRHDADGARHRGAPRDGRVRARTASRSSAPGRARS